MTTLTEVERSVGDCTFEVLGRSITANAQPFRFYMLKRMQDTYDALDDTNRNELDTLLSSCNMHEVLDMRLTREIGRHNNLEAWL